MMKKKIFHTHVLTEKTVGLYITRTHPYLQTIKVLQCCRLFLKQCVVGTCIYQIRLKEAISLIVNYAPVICIRGSLGAGDSGNITGPKCRDLTFDESRQCRRCAGVLISRQNTNLCHILTTRGKLSLYI